MKDSFLHSVSASLIERVGIDHIGEYCLVFPMQRAGVFMKKELMTYVHRLSRQPILAPEFMTIDSLVSQLSDLQPDDEILSIGLLHQLFCQYTGSDISLDVFYGWGAQLRNDFSHIDMALIDAEQLFSNALAAHELERPDLDPAVKERLQALFGGERSHDKDSYYRVYEQIWSSLYDMYHDLNSHLALRQQGYAGARLRRVLEHWDTVSRKLQGRHIAFVGFNYLHHGEAELMRQVLRADDQTLFFWDYRPDFVTNSDAYRFIGEHMKCFPNALTAAAPHPTVPKPVSVIATSGASAQAQFVHDWLLQHREGRTGVVIADESLLEPVIYSLPAEVSGHCNITKGYPLRLTKVYADINTSLSAMPFTSAEQMLQALLAQDILAPFKDKDDDEEADAQKDMSWQELLTAESIYQARTKMERLLWLLEHKQLMEIPNAKTLRNLVRRILDSVTLPFHGDPVMDIQIIGVLETRLLDFDNLLVLNVEEGVIPKENKDLSFIPYYLRKYYGIETHDESSAAYAYNFFRLLRTPENITLLFAQAASGTQQKNMSRFLMQILTSPEYRTTKYRIVEGTRIEPEEVWVNPDWLQTYLPAHNGLMTLSPSSINTYKSCPRQFYLDKIEVVRIEEPVTAIMPANVLGSLVHGAIRAAYMQLCGALPHRVTSEEITTFLSNDDNLSRALDTSYMSIDEPYRNRAAHPVESQVALQYVRNVLAHDKQDAPFDLLAMEKNDYSLSYAVTTPIGPVLVKIIGQVDRIDSKEDGGFRQVRVVDYKTGKAAITDDQALQTRLYCLMVERSEPSLTNLQPTLIYTRDGTVLTPEHEDAFEQSIISTVEQIMNDTRFEQVPLNACQQLSFCPFRTLCHRPAKSW